MAEERQVSLLHQPFKYVLYLMTCSGGGARGAPRARWRTGSLGRRAAGSAPAPASYGGWGRGAHLERGGELVASAEEQQALLLHQLLTQLQDLGLHVQTLLHRLGQQQQAADDLLPALLLAYAAVDSRGTARTLGAPRGR
eukprot:1195994-Prorocentrum_minimum.AAC.2